MTTTTRPDIGTLEFYPALHLDDVIHNLHQYSATLCSEHIPGGLASMHVALTKARYDALELTMPDPKDASGKKTIPLPRSKMPVDPAEPTPGGDSVVAAVYAAKHQRYLDVQKGLTELRNTLVAALGPTIKLNLDHEIATMPLDKILTYLDKKYGEASEGDIQELKRTLEVEFKSTGSFAAEAALMRRTFRKLERFDSVVSPDDRMLALTQATRFIPPIVAAIQQYKFHYPARKGRSFDDMVEYIDVHVPRTTVAATGYVANTVYVPTDTAAPTLSNEPSTAPQLPSGTSGMAAELAQHLIPAMLGYLASANSTRPNPSNRGHSAGRGGRTGRGGRQAGRTVQRSYCFEHGYGHKGTECRTMASDPSYTQEMKNANGPCAIDGWQGHV